MPEENELAPMHSEALVDAVGSASAELSEINLAERKWAGDLIRKLNKQSPMRHLALEILAGQRTKLPIDSLHTVLNDRSPRNWRERAIASWAFGTVPLNKVDTHRATMVLSEILGGQLSHDRFGKGCSRSYLIAYSISVALISLRWLTQASSLPNLLSGFFFMLFASVFIAIPLGLAISPLVVPTSMAKDKTRLNFLRTVAARSLGRLKTPHAIAALAEAGTDGDKNVRENALQSLSLHLPLLSATHYRNVSSATVPALCALLNQKDNSLVIDVLAALGKVGDARALDPVMRLYVFEKVEEVKQAAERILPILEERSRNEKSAEVLLRPTISPDDQSDVLLRAAGMSTVHEESQLLRAILTEGED